MPGCGLSPPLKPTGSIDTAHPPPGKVGGISSKLTLPPWRLLMLAAPEFTDIPGVSRPTGRKPLGGG